MSEVVELLPCPFCGCDSPECHPNALAQFGCEMGREGLDVFYMHCDSCGADGPQTECATSAVVAWNRRDGDKCRHGCKITKAVKRMNESLVSNYEE